MMSPLKRHSNPFLLRMCLNCYFDQLLKNHNIESQKTYLVKKKSFLKKKTDYKVRIAAFPIYSHATYVNYITCRSDISFEYPFANGMAVMYKLHIARTNRVEKFKIFPWHNT